MESQHEVIRLQAGRRPYARTPHQQEGEAQCRTGRFMGSQLRRADEAVKRLLPEASYDSAQIDRRPHRSLLAATVLLLVLPGAASAAELPVVGSGIELPGWASTAELRYGDRGRTGRVAAAAARHARLPRAPPNRRHLWQGDVGCRRALQGWEQIHRDGVVGPQTRRALRHARAPQPWLRLRRALEIDLARQVLLVVENGAVQRAVHASTGAPRRHRGTLSSRLPTLSDSSRPRRIDSSPRHDRSVCTGLHPVLGLSVVMSRPSSVFGSRRRSNQTAPVRSTRRSSRP